MIEHLVSFDASAYSADAIQRAAYRFSDRLSLDLRRTNGDFACTLLLSDDLAGQAEEIIAEFRNEVLDQTLRERIRSETEGVRNLILALAFSNTGLVESTATTDRE
jgi:His-Xaa-Ser system protein HxsD